MIEELIAWEGYALVLKSSFVHSFCFFLKFVPTSVTLSLCQLLSSILSSTSCL